MLVWQLLFRDVSHPATAITAAPFLLLCNEASHEHLHLDVAIAVIVDALHILAIHLEQGGGPRHQEFPFLRRTVGRGAPTRTRQNL